MEWDFAKAIIWVRAVYERTEGELTLKKYLKNKNGGPSVGWLTQNIGRWVYIKNIVESGGDRKSLASYICKTCPRELLEEGDCIKEKEECLELAERTGYMVKGTDYSGCLICSDCKKELEIDNLFVIMSLMNTDCEDSGCSGKLMAKVVAENKKGEW